MTALRQKAVNMLKELPKENLPEIIVVMKKYKNKSEEEKRKVWRVLEESFLKNNKDFDELMELCKNVPKDLDYKKELEESREERFGYENNHSRRGKTWLQHS